MKLLVEIAWMENKFYVLDVKFNTFLSKNLLLNEWKSQSFQDMLL